MLYMIQQLSVQIFLVHHTEYIYLALFNSGMTEKVSTWFLDYIEDPIHVSSVTSLVHTA